jgi:hypothetical protein
MSAVSYLISEKQAASILAKRCGGSVRRWRRHLQIDRHQARPTIPFEGSKETPSYAKHWVYEFILKREEAAVDRPIVWWEAEPEFDHEIGYPRVYVSVARDESLGWAVMDPDQATAFGQRLIELGKRMAAMSVAEARRLHPPLPTTECAVSGCEAEHEAGESISLDETPPDDDEHRDDHADQERHEGREPDEVIVSDEWRQADARAYREQMGLPPESEEEHVDG